MRLGLNLASFASLCFALGACGDDSNPDGGGGSGGEPQGGQNTGGTPEGGSGGEGGNGPQLAQLGEACASNDDCEGGLCLSEDAFGWAQGYCSALCAPDLADCAEGVCLAAGEFSVCILECNDAGDCPGVANECVDLGAERPLTVCLGGCDQDDQCDSGACDNDSLVCAAANEVCDNGADDDEDGLMDCVELDCATDQGCIDAIEGACGGAVALTPGVPVANTTDGAGTSLFIGICDTIFGPSATGFSNEHVYEFTATADGVLTVDATAITGDFGLYARTTCADGATQVACSDNAFDPGEVETLQLPLNTGDVVTIFVDAYDVGYEGDFSIVANFAAVVCGDGIIVGAEQCDDGNAAAGDGCGATCQVEPTEFCAQDVVPVLLGVPVNGDTSTGTTGFEGNCAGAGAERVYSYTPLLSGTATITVDGGDDHDAVLYVRSDCDDDGAGAELDCVDVGFAGDEESVMLPVTAATPVFIFVDSYSALTDGTFTLTVTQ